MERQSINEYTVEPLVATTPSRRPVFQKNEKFPTLVPEVFFSLGATELSRDCESRSDEKKTSGTNG